MMHEPISEPGREHRITSASASLIRGLTRIGIGIAVVVAVIGVVTTATVIIDDYNHWVDESQPSSGFVLDSAAISAFAPKVLIGLGITVGVSLVTIGFFRGLGWIIAGFARD